jgi:hypothetical protein
MAPERVPLLSRDNKADGGAAAASTRVSSPSTERRKPRRRALFAAICVLGSLAGVDLVLHIPGLAPRVYQPRRIEPGMPLIGVKQGPITSFAYRPDTSFWSVYDPAGDVRGYFGSDGRIEYRINGSGFRGPEITIAKPPGVYRIVCLGDSFTFGEGVREEDTYAAQLQKRLDGAVPGQYTQVINAGVQGHGTVDELNWLRIGPAQFAPNVVTLGFCLNDATPNAETMRQHTERTEQFALSLPGRVSTIWAMAERAWWMRRKQDEFFKTTRESFHSRQWEECKEALATFHQESVQRGFRFVVVVFPIFYQLDGRYPFGDLHERVAAACRERGCEYIDLLEEYCGRDAETLWVHPTDQHPNEVAQRLAAERIAEYLRSGPRAP